MAALWRRVWGMTLFFFERRARGMGNSQIPGQQIGKALMRKRPAALVPEDSVIGLSAAFFQPRAKSRDRVSAQRDDLRAAHAGLQRHQQQGVVAPSDPVASIR